MNHSQITSRLLAASCFTRGVWWPLQLWSAVTSVPYRAPTIEWGIDVAFLRRRLSEALMLGLSLAGIEIALLVFFFISHNALAAFLASFLAGLQWFVVPWLAARRELGRVVDLHHSNPGPLDVPSTVVSPGGTDLIGDLGYLVRDAVFSIDVSRKSVPSSESHEISSSHLDLNALHTRILSVVRQSALSIGAYKFALVCADQIRLRFPSLRQALHALRNSGPIMDSPRLLLTAQRPDCDGLSTLEITIREVPPHFSFFLRSRWLPPLARRFQRLAFVAQEHAWWRLGLVPVLLGLGVLLQWLFFGVFFRAMSFGWAFGEALSEGVSANLFFDVETLEIMRETSFHADVSRIWLWLLSFAGPLTPIALLVTIVIVWPIIGTLMSLLWRLLRWLRGLFYDAIGRQMSVEPRDCVRFQCAALDGFEGESTQWAIAHIQVMEEVVTNAIIQTLQDHGIDTNSIREELRAFNIEGIFMTGGSLNAENLIVGKSGKIGKRRRKKEARQGRVALMAKR